MRSIPSFVCMLVVMLGVQCCGVTQYHEITRSSTDTTTKITKHSQPNATVSFRTDRIKPFSFFCCCRCLFFFFCCCCCCFFFFVVENEKK